LSAGLERGAQVQLHGVSRHWRKEAGAEVLLCPVDPGSHGLEEGAPVSIAGAEGCARALHFLDRGDMAPVRQHLEKMAAGWGRCGHGREGVVLPALGKKGRTPWLRNFSTPRKEGQRARRVVEAHAMEGARRPWSFCWRPRSSCAGCCCRGRMPARGRRKQGEKKVAAREK
jgi:hypothetical protein